MVQGTFAPESLLGELPEWLREHQVSRYLSNNYVVVDFETTIIDKGSPYVKENSVVCSGVILGPNHPKYSSSSSFHFKLGDEYNQQFLVELIEDADFWVAHNSKFEYGWLERCGLPLEKSLAFCTQLAEYVLFANRLMPNQLNLNACLKRRGFPMKDDLGTKLLKAELSPKDWPRNWLERYQKGDVVLTEKLFLHQRAALVSQNKLATLFTRCIFTAPLVDIEKNGMHLDQERVTILCNNYIRKQTDLLGKIDQFLDGANPKSPKQMREVLYEKLKFQKPKDKKWLGKNGDPTTSPEYIQTLKPKNKKQERFQLLQKELSNVTAALSKSLEKFKLCCEETADHILTATLNQTITKTQRLSSTGKNYKAQLQNIARIFKPLFSARYEGWSIGEIDQAQLEYRVAVFLGQDENGLKDILNKVDAHGYTASIIFDDEIKGLDLKSDEYKYFRTESKPHTFKPLYGGKSGTTKQKRYYQAFQEKHTGVTAAQKEWCNSAVTDGKVTIPSGLSFYFPNTKILDDGFITNSTNICNYPVQCVDGETEFFTGQGWAKIKDYKNQNIGVYNEISGSMELEFPKTFVINRPNRLVHIKKQGIDMKVSLNHRLLLSTEKTGNLKYCNTKDFLTRYKNNSCGIGDSIITTFSNEAALGVAHTDVMLKLYVAYQADGSEYTTQGKGLRNKDIKFPHLFHFSKKRKVDRLIKLLKEAKLEYKLSEYGDGTYGIRTRIINANKIFSKIFWWKHLNKEQATIISEESWLWDGHKGRYKTYCTKEEHNANFIQYCGNMAGYRCSITKNKQGYFIVGFTRETKPTFKRENNGPSCVIGNSCEKSYCFETSTGNWIARRNGNIFVTGNSFATADIVPVGVTYQWHLMRVAGLRSFLINTIHDSAIAEVHPDETEIFKEIGEYSFVDRVYVYLKEVYNVDFNVPLESECLFSKNWSDSKGWQENYLGE